MSRLRGFVEIVRPINSAMIGAAVIVGVTIAGGLGRVPPQALALSFLTGFALTGAAMVVNDYFDREIDSINEPGRPIPRGDVKPHEAFAYAATLSAVGLGAAYLTAPDVLLLASASWVVMAAYSAWGKRTGFPGNLMVSACIAVPFLYGGLLAGSFGPSLLFGSIAFLANTGREVTKGIVDQEGDWARGVLTVAVTHDAETAAKVASGFFVAAVLASAAPVVLGLVSPWYVPPVAVTDIGLVYGAVRLLREPEREVARSVKNQVLIWMLFGLLAFAAGSLVK